MQDLVVTMQFRNSCWLTKDYNVPITTISQIFI